MKTYLTVLCLMTAVSCGRVERRTTVVEVAPPEILEPEPLRIENRWVNLRDHSLLDLTQVRINSLQSSEDVLNCSGSLGNNGTVNGVPQNKVIFTGSGFEGTIQFGHLSYVNATDSRCQAFSKERYEYEMVGNYLKIRNITWCASHVCLQDGIEFYEQE